MFFDTLQRQFLTFSAKHSDGMQASWCQTVTLLTEISIHTTQPFKICIISVTLGFFMGTLDRNFHVADQGKEMSSCMGV